MSDEKKKTTSEEVIAALNDPKVLQAVLAKVQGSIPRTEPTRPVPKVRERPKIEIPADATQEETIAYLNKALNSIIEYNAGIADDKVGEVKEVVANTEKGKVAKEIQDFAAKHKHFGEIIEHIEPFWQTGKYTLEKAYELGKIASGKKSEEFADDVAETKPTSKEKETPKEEHTPRSTGSVPSTEETETPEKGALKSKVTSIKDAATKNLAALIAEKGRDEVLGETEGA